MNLNDDMRRADATPGNGRGEFARSLGIDPLHIEMTNVCNFDCSFCPISRSTRTPGRMDIDLFKNIVNEVAENGVAKRIGFHVMGEPLLHPGIFSAIGYVAEKDLRSTLTTNGGLLVNSKVQDLVKSPLNSLAISLETNNAGEHESRRSGLDFSIYYDRVLQAIAELREKSKTYITIHLMNTITKKLFMLDDNTGINIRKWNLREKIGTLIGDIRRAIGRPLSRKEIEKKTAKIKLNSLQHIEIDEQIQIYIQFFWDWGNAFTARRAFRAKIGCCGYAGRNAAVLHDGRVTLCCGDYDGRTALGRVQDSSLVTLLESAIMRRVTGGFARGRVVHPYCQRCMGSIGPIATLLKGLASIYLFRRRGHPLKAAKKSF
ncbi:MAG: radical SAM protein [Deltaproteobacteria bacterium]|nr:MAG: radical SAM protein [Deltaproteobacteria bacterium]